VPRLALPSADRIPGGRAFASLSRRVRTLIIAAALFTVMFILLLTMPVPYVVLSPGPTADTLGSYDGQVVVVLDGREANKTTGHLNLTTVSVSSGSITALQALTAWLRGDEVVAPRASVFPPGESDEQVQQQNTQDFLGSQDNATAAALCELDYPKGFGVLDVEPKGPSDGILEPGDFIKRVDGKAVDSFKSLAALLAKEQPGKRVAVGIVRGGKPDTVQVELAKAPEGRDGAILGIHVTIDAKQCLAPFSISLCPGCAIGGPSAGLMFALGIIEKIGPFDLTGGQFIAGTGEIDAKGNVGSIGGIQLKMIAARDAGASVFLAPAGNCGDVNGATPDGLQVIKVSTLHGAVRDLQRVQDGESVPSC
jgi:PDZ domain-containing protein